MPKNDLITHTLSGKTVMQRDSDGYISATSMCNAAGKKLNDYKRLGNTQEFIAELASITGIPAIDLIKSCGDNRKMGTWVHPKVAIHLAQWLSPKVAVQVTTWVHDWMLEGKAPQPEQEQIQLPVPEKPLEHRIITFDPNTGKVYERAYQGKIFIFTHQEFSKSCLKAVEHFHDASAAVRGMMACWHSVEALTKEGAERLAPH